MIQLLLPLFLIHVLPSAFVFSDESQTTLSAGDLPVPPDDVAELLECGRVTFRYGPRPSLGNDALADQSLKVAGETRFHLEYRYSSRTRWRTRRGDDERQVVIDVEYDSLRLDFFHDVWFRKKPSLQSFWDERLVRHELDHVRISSNPRIEERFAALVRRHSTIVRAIPQETAVDNALVRELVKQQVQEAFDEIVDLVQIRYVELDRLTRHGMRPLPAGAESLW